MIFIKQSRLKRKTVGYLSYFKEVLLLSPLRHPIDNFDMLVAGEAQVHEPQL